MSSHPECIISALRVAAFILILMGGRGANVHAQPEWGMRLWMDKYMIGPTRDYSRDVLKPGFEQTLPRDWQDKVSGIAVTVPNLWVTFYTKPNFAGERLHMPAGTLSNLYRVRRDDFTSGPHRLFVKLNWEDRIKSFRVRDHRPSEPGTYCPEGFTDWKQCTVIENPPPPNRPRPQVPPPLIYANFTGSVLYVFEGLIRGGAVLHCSDPGMKRVRSLAHGEEYRSTAPPPGYTLWVRIQETPDDACDSAFNRFEGRSTTPSGQ